MIEQRISVRRRVTLLSHITMLLCQIFSMVGGICVGIILVSSVIFSEQEFWDNCAAFWRWV